MAKYVHHQFQEDWAQVCGMVFGELSDVANDIHAQPDQLEDDLGIHLEHHIKFFFSSSDSDLPQIKRPEVLEWYYQTSTLELEKWYMVSAYRQLGTRYWYHS